MVFGSFGPAALRLTFACISGTKVRQAAPGLVSRRHNLRLGDAIEGGMDENLAVYMVDVYALSQSLQVTFRSR